MNEAKTKAALSINDRVSLKNETRLEQFAGMVGTVTGFSGYEVLVDLDEIPQYLYSRSHRFSQNDLIKVNS